MKIALAFVAGAIFGAIAALLIVPQNVSPQQSNKLPVVNALSRPDEIPVLQSLQPENPQIVTKTKVAEAGTHLVDSFDIAFGQKKYIEGVGFVGHPHALTLVCVYRVKDETIHRTTAYLAIGEPAPLCPDEPAEEQVVAGEE